MTDTSAIAVYRKCGHCAVHHSGLCGVLGPVTSAELAAMARTVHLEPEQTLAREGDTALLVGNVVSGVLRLVRMLPDGRVQIVGLLHASDFFGCLFHDTCEYTIEAATPAELCVFDKTAFEALVRRHPDLEHAVMMSIMTELDAAREWIVLLGSKSAMERVASYLWILVARAGNQGCRALAEAIPAIYEIPISRTDMGRYLGLTLETVSRQFSRLASQGVIRLIGTRRFVLLDRGRLRDLSAMEEGEAERMAGRLPGAGD